MLTQYDHVCIKKLPHFPRKGLEKTTVYGALPVVPDTIST